MVGNEGTLTNNYYDITNDITMSCPPHATL